MRFLHPFSRLGGAAPTLAGAVFLLLAGFSWSDRSTAPAYALGNGLALKPPMGWNTYYTFRCNIDATLVKQTADAMVANGMKAAGYEYVNIDDCWQVSRDAGGRIVADPVRFPPSSPGANDGIKVLAGYVHSRGLKLGIYTSAGTATCYGRPGSLGYEATDAQTYAQWEVDFVKVDWCSASGLDPKPQYGKWRDAILAAGRPMVFSICSQGIGTPWVWGPDSGNMWRTTGDIPDRWLGFLSVVDKNEPLAQNAGPGGWNDPDILQVGRNGMTDVEYRSQFSLWAMMAAPLIAGNDVRSMTAYTRETLTNTGVIAVNQDPRGVQGRVVWKNRSNDLQVWAKPLQQSDGKHVRAVLLFNRMYNKKQMTVNWADVGLAPGTITEVRDLWTDQLISPQSTQNPTGYSQTGYTTTVIQHAVVVLRVVATQQQCTAGNAWLC